MAASYFAAPLAHPPPLSLTTSFTHLENALELVLGPAEQLVRGVPQIGDDDVDLGACADEDADADADVG